MVGRTNANSNLANGKIVYIGSDDSIGSYWGKEIMVDKDYSLCRISFFTELAGIVSAPFSVSSANGNAITQVYTRNIGDKSYNVTLEAKIITIADVKKDDVITVQMTKQGNTAFAVVTFTND